jgi:hypothetical protein
VDFQTKLVEELRSCATGKWGMFAQNEEVIAREGWTGAATSMGKDLLALAEKIEVLRNELGYTEPFALATRYIEYRAMRGPNTPGEPKLAKLFLEELRLT